MPPESISTDPVTGLIKIERFGKFEGDLVPCLQLLDRVRKGHERMVSELEMNVVLIAEMLHPMDPCERSRTIS